MVPPHGRAAAKGLQPPRATCSRTNPGRIQFFIFFRRSRKSVKTPTCDRSSVASGDLGRLAAVASWKKMKILDPLAAAASQLKSEKGKEKTTCGRRKLGKMGDQIDCKNLNHTKIDHICPYIQ